MAAKHDTLKRNAKDYLIKYGGWRNHELHGKTIKELFDLLDELIEILET